MHMSLSKRWFLLASLICAALAGALLLPGLGGGFVFDDGSNIVNNPGIQLESLHADALSQVLFGVQPGGITRILPTLSFALDYWRGHGLNPAVFKATNITIHALITFVLAWFFRTLLLTTSMKQQRASLIALALTLAWAIHPLQISSVLYVVQRMQTMCTLFLLLALLTYLKARQAQIEGRPGRTGWLLTALFWALAFGCKEDAVLLPAYTLALELTVLRFRTHNPELANKLRKGYFLAALLGTAIFLIAVVPYYWHWDDYPGRDFSSYERLLTQGRVLCMYLWEILLPFPSHMPFYYDWFQPSSSLLQPWTTFPAILLVIALLAVAWKLRIRRPLFALGIFIFFAGHFITSNVAGLELAFEHRNHFPLIGVVLAVGDLLTLTTKRLRIHPVAVVTASILLLSLLGGTAVARARIWGSPLQLAYSSTKFAPHSARAWNSLCVYYYELGGMKASGNPYLRKAIDICGKGVTAAPYSVTNLVNMIVFKSRLGISTRGDWDLLLNRLQWVNMGPENINTIMVLMYNVNDGVALDENNTLKAIDIISQRTSFGPNELSAIGDFILTQTNQPEKAYPYFAKSIQLFWPRYPKSTEALIAKLRSQGKNAWAEKLEALAHKQDKLQDRQ